MLASWRQKSHLLSSIQRILSHGHWSGHWGYRSEHGKQKLSKLPRGDTRINHTPYNKVLRAMEKKKERKTECWSGGSEGQETVSIRCAGKASLRRTWEKELRWVWEKTLLGSGNGEEAARTHKLGKLSERYPGQTRKGLTGLCKDSRVLFPRWRLEQVVSRVLPNLV